LSHLTESEDFLWRHVPEVMKIAFEELILDLAYFKGREKFLMGNKYGYYKSVIYMGYLQPAKVRSCRSWLYKPTC
jgi:hypothetical protein